LDELSDCLLCALNNEFGEDFKVDHVLVENQPMLKNGMMKTVSVIIYTYFNIMKLQYGNMRDVRFVSASGKLKKIADEDTRTYKDRKSKSIALARKNLMDWAPDKIEWFDGLKKSDDAADSLCQAIYFIDAMLPRFN
jgi:hypothetical protein